MPKVKRIEKSESTFTPKQPQVYERDLTKLTVNFIEAWMRDNLERQAQVQKLLAGESNTCQTNKNLL
mgnify:CR=1 FL=1